MPLEAWYMDDDTVTDQRALHRREPNVPVTREQLDALGVLSWHLDADNDRGYSYTDTITITPEKLPNYEAKIKTFYEEHLHTDEEIRYCLDGSGYFDVRDAAERWIRIHVQKGDLIILPAGIYHRFTLDTSNYIVAMRLFVGEPVWTPYNRSAALTDDMAPRKAYVRDFVAKLSPGSASDAAAQATHTAAAGSA